MLYAAGQPPLIRKSSGLLLRARALHACACVTMMNCSSSPRYDSHILPLSRMLRRTALQYALMMSHQLLRCVLSVNALACEEMVNPRVCHRKSKNEYSWGYLQRTLHLGSDDGIGIAIGTMVEPLCRQPLGRIAVGSAFDHKTMGGG